MKGFTTFRGFFFALFGIFLLTWFLFVVYPWLELGHLSPIIDDDNVTITPWDSSGAAHAGEKVYAANGCVYCHTQQVRDPGSSEDLTRGWGTAFSPEDPKNAKKDVTRRSYPRDYIWQGQTFLGNSREGADLTNVAKRFPDAAGLYSYLYDPYVLNPHSSMPAYRFMFVTQKISGQPSQDALVLPKEVAAPDGYEIVPTPQAKSLVAYLLSLNKGYHLKADEAGLRYEPPAPTKS